jgi:hypothetical protein
MQQLLVFVLSATRLCMRASPIFRSGYASGPSTRILVGLIGSWLK